MVVTAVACWLAYELNWIYQRHKFLAEHGALHFGQAPNLLWLFGKAPVGNMQLNLIDQREMREPTAEEHEYIGGGNGSFQRQRFGGTVKSCHFSRGNETCGDTVSERYEHRPRTPLPLLLTANAARRGDAGRFVPGLAGRAVEVADGAAGGAAVAGSGERVVVSTAMPGKFRVDAPWSLRLLGEAGIVGIGLDEVEFAGPVPYTPEELQRLFPEARIEPSRDGRFIADPPDGQ